MIVLKISSCIIQVLLLLIWQALALEVEHIRLLDSYSLLLGASLSSSFKVSPGSEYYSVMVCDQSNNNDCNSDTFCRGDVQYVLYDQSNSTVSNQTQLNQCQSGIHYVATSSQQLRLVMTCLSPICTSSGKNLDACRFYTSSRSVFFDGGATAIGAIVGIVIACIALACCMFWVVYCICQTRTPRYRDSFPEYDLQAYTYPPPPPPSLYPLQPQGYNSSPNAPSYPGMYGRDPMEQPPLAQASAVQNSAPIYVSTPVYPASKN